MAEPTAPLTVSLVNSLVVDRDAISNVVRQNADALAKVPGGCRTKIFVEYRSAVTDTRLAYTPNAAALAADPHFRASDVVVFHFGFWYDLFPAIQLAPRTAHVVGLYFGVTPTHLLKPEQHEDIRRSYRQGSHLAAADTVLVTADSLRKDLELFGVPADKAVKIGLPVSFRPVEGNRTDDGPVRFLYVSRFVRGKGTHDLLAAVRTAVGRGADIRLDLVGSLTFSDKAYLAKLQTFVTENRLSDKVTFHLNLSNDELAERYALSHCLVSPSHHEGFGVPIVEALTAGCYVICSDAYSSPETAGGMGLVYRTGDSTHLADRMAEFAAAAGRGLYPLDGDLVPVREWTVRAATYASQFAPPAYADQFRQVVLGGLKTGVTAAARRFGAEACKPLLAGRPATSRPPLAAVYEKYSALRSPTPVSGVERVAA